MCSVPDTPKRPAFVGAVTVTQQIPSIARSPDRALIVRTALAGCPSARALSVLRQVSDCQHRA
ncbi:hypothetical protein ACFH04_00815 [Streptomyces noboritoensis]|uniref:Transposase n=1 Tax=Streptomyces noboritoensis TaxID=67337 RepID=A0ABV6TAW8_9ACTN